MRMRWVILPVLAVCGLAAVWALWPGDNTADAGLISVPSGQAVTLQEVINNEPGAAGLTARFRFVAPEIAQVGGSISFEAASRDMEMLCNSYALPRVAEIAPPPAQIVISLSEAPTEHGVTNQNITQFFEAYRVEDERCIWEGF